MIHVGDEAAVGEDQVLVDTDTQLWWQFVQKEAGLRECIGSMVGASVVFGHIYVGGR
jgi:hypothetical protein